MCALFISYIDNPHSNSNNSNIVNFIAIINKPFAPVLLLLVIAPYCIIRFLFPRAKLATTITFTCMMIVILNTLIPIIMHISNRPINNYSLTTIHVLLSVLAYTSMRLRKTPAIPTPDSTDKKLILIIGLFAIIIIPFTALTGIDTYKWLDLATSMKVEQSIPWLLHPLSLLGFTTGRSYPSAQPLILGSIMTISNLNVEWSFYFMSLISGILGITSAFLLSKKCFSTSLPSNRPSALPPSRPSAPVAPSLIAAFFYGFSPVFIRYNHWATGRGLFIAIFPLFLLAFINLSKTEIQKTKTRNSLFIIGNLAALISLGLFLTLSHKAGLIAILMIIISILPGMFLPRRNWHWLVPILTIMAVTATIALSPNKGAPLPLGLIIGFIYASITRFGWLLPLAAIGLLLTKNWLGTPSLRRIFPALLVSLPFSCAREMYGALIALIFITLAATNGFIWLITKLPDKKIILQKTTIIMIIIGALAIIVQRSRIATPHRIRTAALFLEQYDPAGPFQITSKKWRTKIQGYVSGCPRFKITKTGSVKAYIQRPPSIKGNPAQILAAWTSYSRHIITVSGLSLSYYGNNPRRYIFLIDQPNKTPNGTVSIYKKNGIEIFKPITQKTPTKELSITVHNTEESE